VAKLAANLKLRESRRVGLITLDTYRIAAVDQLKRYAEIIGAPLKVVSSADELHEAIRTMADLEFILIDTAGRSPNDKLKLGELKKVLGAAQPDEVHLVLSSATGARVLEQTAERFASAGTTAILLTKLDESTGLGNLLPLVRSTRLPLSYLPTGQNVPDDIEVADAGRLSRLMLKMEQCGTRNHQPLENRKIH
jgi:flagellar biosynthesis protein FlhF